MLRRARKLLWVALLAGCLPLPSAADTASPEEGSETPAQAAAAADPQTPAADATQSTSAGAAAGGEKVSLQELKEALDPVRREREASEELEGVTATIVQLQSDGIRVRVTGTSTETSLEPVFFISGGKGVKVSGRGKNSWFQLRRGDLVLVSYRKGDPPVARKVNVLPRATDPILMAALGIDPRKPKGRSFVGYIKMKEGDELHVLSPAPPNHPPGHAEVKRFVRHEGTAVELMRDSWDTLRKGDRVKIDFQKGNPRPADRIQVIRRGGEEPLPPGVATRIFDPDYDKSIRDVDGIGETGPVPRVPPRALPKRKIKIPRQN